MIAAEILQDHLERVEVGQTESMLSMLVKDDRSVSLTIMLR